MQDSFKDRGLLKVTLPREKIAPLMIIQKVSKGTGEIIGNVEELFSSTTSSLPLLEKDEKVSEFSGDNTAKLDLEAGLSMLKGIWSKLGKGELNAKFEKEDVVSFHFKNLLRDAIKSEIVLNNYLYTSISAIGQGHPYRDALVNDDLYVITSVLRSNDFTITVHNEKTGEAKLSVDLKDLVNAGLSVGGSMEAQSSITNNGGYMVFAVRAKKIHYRKGNLFLKEKFSLTDPEDIKVLGNTKRDIEFPSEDGNIEFV